MKLFLTKSGPVIESNSLCYSLFDISWDELINKPRLRVWLAEQIDKLEPLPNSSEIVPLKPMGDQELWACGVTYQSSKYARMEEAEAAGGGDFYARVYVADRPELFFKALPSRVVGPEEGIRIRRDSTWDVPEPEVTLVINASGEIVGFTIGDDMSSRSIEGENPLYLPQAKSYDKCAAVGPCVFVLPDTGMPGSISVELRIIREGATVFEEKTSTSEMKRSFEELRDYLFSEMEFPNGVYLMTGTGIVPGQDFTLEVGDVVEIAVDEIGTLRNIIECK